MLVPWTVIEPEMPALEAWNLNAGPPWKWINIDFAFKKNPMVNQEDCAAIGEVNGNPLQYSFMSGKSHGLRSLVGYNPWGRKESHTTERLLCVRAAIILKNKVP